MSRCRAPTAFPYADLAYALGHGDHHDVHDADAADEERNAGDRGEQDHERRFGGLERLDGVFLVGDGEVFLAVANIERAGNLVGCLLGTVDVRHLHVDAGHRHLAQGGALRGEPVVGRRDRDHHLEVFDAKGVAAFAFKHADDPEPAAGDSHLGAHGVAVPEQGLGHRRTEHDDLFVVDDVGRRDEEAREQIEVSDLGIVRGHPRDLGGRKVGPRLD